MIKSLPALPDNYIHIGTLDLRKNTRMMVLMNVFALFLVIPFGWFFWRMFVWMRPELADSWMKPYEGDMVKAFLLILVLLGVNVVMLILHEGIHGFFFWWFTRSKPVFALKTFYAFAAAPGWYLPRNQYLLVSLSPLMLISLFSLLLMPFVPLWLFMPVLALAVFNAAGSTGDLAVAFWLLRQPGTCLANDRGDTFSLYLPGKNP